MRYLDYTALSNKQTMLTGYSSMPSGPVLGLNYILATHLKPFLVPGCNYSDNIAYIPSTANNQHDGHQQCVKHIDGPLGG